MKIDVLFFASSKELTGTSQIRIDLPEGSTTEYLKKSLMSMFSNLDLVGNKISIALNQVYCRENCILHDNDVVAILPPISGG